MAVWSGTSAPGAAAAPTATAIPEMDVADPERLPPITRGRLQLDDPVCRAWVNFMMLRLARTMPPERALAWWMRLHIALNSKAPAYILPEGWTPACAEACLLEAYVGRETERFRPSENKE